MRPQSEHIHEIGHVRRTRPYALDYYLEVWNLLYSHYLRIYLNGFFELWNSTENGKRIRKKWRAKNMTIPR